MTEERILRAGEVFRFYGYGERRRTYDLENFNTSLIGLLNRERPEIPNKPGTLLLLDRSVTGSGVLRGLLKVSRQLLKNGFYDTQNWSLGSESDPTSWWVNKLALDVVGVPAFSDRNGKHFLVEDCYEFYRLYTRPSYLPKSSVSI